MRQAAAMSSIKETETISIPGAFNIFRVRHSDYAPWVPTEREMATARKNKWSKLDVMCWIGNRTHFESSVFAKEIRKLEQRAKEATANLFGQKRCIETTIRWRYNKFVSCLRAAKGNSIRIMIRELCSKCIKLKKINSWGPVFFVFEFSFGYT